MVIKQKIGNIKDFKVKDQTLDYLDLEWYETSKKILHKSTRSGVNIVLKFLSESQSLEGGDILYQDEQTIISVDIKACECIVLKPATMYEMAFICYEIGNKHLPLFYGNDELMIPYEAPIFKMLQASGFSPQLEKRKLLNQLKTTVAMHSHTGNKSLFSKILQLTSPDE